MMSYEGEEDKEEEMANLEDQEEIGGNSEKERLRKDSDGDSLVGSENGNHDPSYEDVLLDEEHTKSTNNFTAFEMENAGEIPVADPTGSSFFFATYPRLIEYKSTYDRARELVILNQNKIFLSMVIAVTVLGLLGILIYFSVKTWNAEDDSLIISTLDGSLILLEVSETIGTNF